jgi:protocatechuate 3,4-dioxygenase beta subunit
MDDHDKGLAHDLDALGRRRALIGGAGFAALTLLAAWAPRAEGASAAPAAAARGCTAWPVAPEETEGPFPADGSNRDGTGELVNALALTGIVRSDIRPSFGAMKGVAEGVATTLALRLVDAGGRPCAELAGHAVYVWHCDRDGFYSLYDQADQNYLRGVQVTDAHGMVRFTTVFPACYAGRMPHIHVEVYRGAAGARSHADKLLTTQIALPVDVCRTVYANARGYGESVDHLEQTSFATDMVFRDGVDAELAGVRGSVATGYAISHTLGLAVRAP